jgi:hypothetical protein
MIHADYLFLLTDVDGLYTANPRKDTSARLIELVESTAAIRTQGIPLPSCPPPEMYQQLITIIACYSEHGDSWLELRYRRDGNKTDRGRDRYRSRCDDNNHLEPQPCLSLFDSRVPRRDFRSEHRQRGPTTAAHAICAIRNAAARSEGVDPTHAYSRGCSRDRLRRAQCTFAP